MLGSVTFKMTCYAVTHSWALCWVRSCCLLSGLFRLVTLWVCVAFPRNKKMFLSDYQKMEEILPGYYAAFLGFCEPLLSNRSACVYLCVQRKVYLDTNSESISSHWLIYWLKWSTWLCLSILSSQMHSMKTFSWPKNSKQNLHLKQVSSI